MTDYNEILDDELVPDSPVTSILAFRLRDNVLAITEGAEGAPKNSGKSMSIAIGNLTGSTAIVDLDDAAKVLLIATGQMFGNTDNASISIGYQRSSDNGGSWGATVQISTATGRAEDAVSLSGSRIVDMVGFNAIRLLPSGTGGGSGVSRSVSGSLIYVEGT